MSSSSIEKLFAPRRDYRLRNALIVAALVALVAAGTFGGIGVHHILISCATGGSLMGGECIGVTDGSYDFSPDLKAADACISNENHTVQQGKYVTIAFLGPLSSTSTSLTTGRVPHLLEGACTALRRAEPGGPFGDHPQIKMLLANEGADEDGYKQVVAQLARMTGAPDHLVAVVGLGLSQTESLDAARRLSSAGIPMVEDVITADGLDSSQVPGLTRVAPSVSQQLAAIGSYLPATQPHAAALIQDTYGGDLYDATLARSFKSVLAAYWQAGDEDTEAFDASPKNRDLGNAFQRISDNLCANKSLDMAFFAGRVQYLRMFLTSWKERSCPGRPFAIVTGSDAADLKPDDVRTDVSVAPVSVLYTPLADPGWLASADNPDRGHYADFVSVFHQQLEFPSRDLDDGWAIMSHDAVITAALAIRHAAGSSAGQSTLPSPGQVSDQLYLLNGRGASVPGAGGTFHLNLTGNPSGRPLHVVKLTADGRMLVDEYTIPAS